MASYHRVLQVFGRSTDEKSVECDYDIHPWDILINGERWAGKIRLIGFVDVFFVICYSGVSRFEHGILIHKDDEAIRNTLAAAGISDADKEIGLKVVNKEKAELKDGAEPKKYFQFEKERDGLDYRITSLGHTIGLKTTYPKSSLQKYEIKVRKGKDRVMKRRIRRGVTQHDLFDMMHDAIRLGVITHAELIGTVLGRTVGGSMLEDMTGKYLDALGGGKGSKNQALSADRI